MQQRPLEERVSAVGALEEPLRRDLLDLIARSDHPVGRDEAAQALGLARSTASFHLDRLAAEGLVEVEFGRLNGRTGPGSGRPAKLYRRSTQEVVVSVPERRYDLAGELLLRAVERAGQTGESPQEALGVVAREAGRDLGRSTGSLQAALDREGFEPERRDDGAIVLRNCPFHRLVEGHLETVCGLNLALLGGVLEGSEEQGYAVELAPAPGFCCVRATPRRPAD
jgi:predicted ArsR family transcriptional regulator